MPAAELKLKYVLVDRAGLYRYNRTVPEALREAVGRKMWNLSLGRDPDTAADKARAYARQHDAMIARLRDPAERERRDEMVSLIHHVHAPDMTETEAWRRTPDELKAARSLSASAEHHRLATFAAIAFGVAMPPIAAAGTMVEFLPQDIPPPSDPTDAIMFSAYRAALESRLAQIAPKESTDPMRLSALIDIYAKAQATRPNTANGYRRKIDRLVRFAGDHGLPRYDEAILRGYRDYLIAGDPEAKPKPFGPVKPATVHQYFAPLKAMWKWAADEYPEHKELAFPRVRLSKDGDTVEDTRWQAFDDQQVKTVWQAASAAWGDEGDTRLTPSRRRAFLMAVRVLLYTGMRPSEVFRLTASDVKDDAIYIRYTKTKNARRIPLATALSDFPDFLAAGGFAAELEAGRKQCQSALNVPPLSASKRDPFGDVASRPVAA